MMAKKATVMAVVNQKGGTGKTTTTENLGVGLAMEGKKVLVQIFSLFRSNSIPHYFWIWNLHWPWQCRISEAAWAA